MLEVKIDGITINYNLIKNNNILVNLGNLKMIIPIKKISRNFINEEKIEKKVDIINYFTNNKVIRKYIKEQKRLIKDN